MNEKNPIAASAEYSAESRRRHARTLDREYPLPDAGARPRRIAITPDDAVWYTDYARGYLGRFDPWK
jgi:streptogramin lyase